MLEVKNLRVSKNGYDLVKNVSFSVSAGDWLMIAGPNGAGKSTMVRAIAQTLQSTGEITVSGKNARKLGAGELARELGVLSQYNYVGYPFTVEEVVSLGRYAYSKGFFAGNDGGDGLMVKRALELTGLTALSGRSAMTLSGGALHRTFLAQLIAQDPRVMILDEPTNHLDLIYQKQIFGLMRGWLKTPGRAVISVVHDLSLAKAYGSRALLLKDGETLSIGGADEVLSPENLQNAYSMDVYGWMESMYSQWK